MYGRNRTIVTRKAPSFLEAFLYSTGIGMEKGADRYYKDRNRKRGVTQSILGSVLEGDVSPELLATDLGRSIMEQMGIGSEPAIREIQKTGEETWKSEQPEIGPPAPLTMQHLRSRDEQIKEAKAQKKMQRELFEYEMKERIKRRVERAFRMPLDKRLETAMGEYEKAIKAGVSIEDVKITDPATGITIDLLTHVEQLKKTKTDETAQTKAGITYLKEELKFHGLLMDSAKFLHGLESDEGVTAEMSQLAKDLLQGFGKKSLSAEEAKRYSRRLIPIINQKIEAQHRILRKQKRLAKESDITLPFMKQFKVDEVLNPGKYVGEFEAIKALSDLAKKSDQEAIREVELKEAKLRKALNPKDTRLTINPPSPPDDESIDPSEVVEGEQTITNSVGDTMVVRNGKWVKVKKKS